MLRFVLWAGQAALLALLLAAFFARYVHPREAWWLQGIAVGMPFLVGLAAACAIGHAWARQPVGAGVWLVVLAALAPRYIGWPDRGGDRTALHVLSFNADDTYLGHQDRRPMEDVLGRYRPDLVALQEAHVSWFELGNGEQAVSTPFYLLPLLADPDLHLPPPDTVSGRTPQRLPLFTSLPWESFNELHLWGEPGPGPQSTGSRSVVIWEGQPVAVYNVHLRSFGPTRPWRQNQREGMFSIRAWRRALATFRQDFVARAEDAERLRQQLDAEPLPYLVMGDLNSTPHHWAYGHLVRAGLRDAHRLAGRGWGATYHDRLPLVRIDHVLVSRHWGVRRARVLRSVTSDHRPVFASLVLLHPAP